MDYGEFFIVWIQVALWGGLVLAFLPVACELLYMFYEFPLYNGGEAWAYQFWDAAFFMLVGQGFLWVASTIIHLIYVWDIMDVIAARKALEWCACDPCDLPPTEDEIAKAQARAICDAACVKKR